MMYEDDLEFEAGDLILEQAEHAGRHRDTQGSSCNGIKVGGIMEGSDRSARDGYIIQDGEDGDSKMPAIPDLIERQREAPAKVPSGQEGQRGPNEVTPSERMSKNGPKPIENGRRVPDVTASTVHGNGCCAGRTGDQLKEGQPCEQKNTCPMDNQRVRHTSRMEAQGPTFPVGCGTESTETLKWWDLDSSSRKALVQHVLNGGSLDEFEGDVWSDVK
jgi:uncharacterized protein YfcZ (UPF0381/DUF406 family)